MKKIPFLTVLLISLFLFSKSADAKVLPQAAKSAKPVAAAKTTGSGISVSPKLRADRRALVVNFGNLQNAKAVSYTLTYQTLVQEEGAVGNLNLNGISSTSVELLFGTCSKNVCRYHTNITNMKLEVSYTSKSGKKSIKRFRIKV